MLLDSNIIIYISKKKDFGNFLKNKIFSASIISKLEVLGFHKLIEKDKLELELLFKTILLIPIDETILEKAISLRQKRTFHLVIQL